MGCSRIFRTSPLEVTTVPHADSNGGASKQASMVYVALLRAINVGGRNIIKMDRLKACFDEKGFDRAVTFIQSGNVVFGSDLRTPRALEKTIEAALSKTFNYSSTVVVRSLAQLRRTLAEVPPDWKTRSDLRCNVAFVKAPVTACAGPRRNRRPERRGLREAGTGSGLYDDSPEGREEERAAETCHEEGLSGPDDPELQQLPASARADGSSLSVQDPSNHFRRTRPRRSTDSDDGAAVLPGFAVDSISVGGAVDGVCSGVGNQAKPLQFSSPTQLGLSA